MIGDILPNGVEAVEAVGDDPLASLLPLEEAALGHVVEGRRREFTVARSCARRAFGKLGLPPLPVLRGAHREPIWPDGVVGSITHCPGYSAAAVARRGDFLSVGIDAEVHGELPPGVLQKISLREERAWLERLKGTGVCWDRVLFSAKESIYKVWFPVTGRWLGFEEALMQIDPAGGTIRARLLAPGLVVGGRHIECIDGRFCVQNGFVLTFAGIPARPGDLR
jgi:4'-phosphopantetheinyl transferase EntD